MKKILPLLLVVMMCFGVCLVGCGSDDDSSGAVSTTKPTTTSYSINAYKTALNPGDTLQLTLSPAVSGVEWYSSKPTVASVNRSSGLVTVKSKTDIPSNVALPCNIKITAMNANGDTLATIDLVVDKTWEERVAEANASGKSVTLSALNCKENLSFGANGVVTDMKKTDAISNSEGSIAYLVYPVNVTKSSSISIEAKIRYSQTSNMNGPALILHNGQTCLAYRALTDQGVKNVKVDASCDDLLKTGGNGYTYYTGYDASYILSHEIIGKVIVENGQATMNYYTTSGNPVATKSHKFEDYFADGSVVNLAIGGNTTEYMTIREIYITENNDKKLVTGIDNSGLAGLSVEKTKLRIKLGATATVNVTALNAGGVAANVNAVSKDTSKVTVSVASPNIEKISVVTLTGVSPGTTTVTVTHATQANLSRDIQVSIDNFAESDNYSDFECFPAKNATNAPVDGWYRLKFDDTPGLLTGGAIMIYDASDKSLVDTILFADEKLQVWKDTNLLVRDQLVYVDGNNLYFMPHYGVLEYGKEYYVAIPKAAVSGTLSGQQFHVNGISNEAKTWKFTTRAAPTLSTTITVNNAEDDTMADFRTVQAAMRAAADIENVSDCVTINVASGIYNELDYYKGKNNIKIVGPSGNTRGNNCQLAWNNYEKMNSGTHNRAQFYFNGANLTLKNLSFKNKFVRSATEQEGQAECIYFAGGGDKKLVAYNCSFSSYQDTIQTTGRNWFYDCFIEGDVDFIWGTADVCLIEKCNLKTLNDSRRQNKTADLLVPRVATLDANIIPKGYVVFDSTFEVETGIKQSLGRVAGTGNFFDQGAVINTNVTGAGLIDEIWNNGTAPVGLPKVDGIQHVGWKDYGVKVNGAAVDASKRCAKDYCGTITDAIYTAEYSNRDMIMNRVYNKTSNSYQASGNGAWDLSPFYSEFGITN